MTIRVGGNIIAGAQDNAKIQRGNIGEIVTSTIPLTDAGLHLLDGGVIQRGSYADFVDYIADLYNNDPTASYFAQPLEEQDWVQPTLSENGTLGGNSFACEADSTYSDFYAYKALDGNSSTSWQSNGTTSSGTWFKFYNPTPIKVIQITWSGTPTYGTITGGVVYGSNDNSNYTQIGTFSNGTTTGGTIDLSTNINFYKYYKITPTTWTDKSGTLTNGWAELTITAKTQSKTAEQVWQDSVTTYGICSKFVYDSVNNTVRLPKYTSEHGDLIKSYSSSSDWYRVYSDGWCEQGGFSAEGTIILLKEMTNTNYAIFATSHYNTVAGDYTEAISEVTTQSFKLTLDPTGQVQDSDKAYWQALGYTDISDLQQSPIYEYLVIATSTKTQIEVDIDEIATDLNGKADTDLSNVIPTQDIKNEIISWGMPDYDAGISITGIVSGTGTYIAEYTGLLSATLTATNSWVYFRKGSSTGPIMTSVRQTGTVGGYDTITTEVQKDDVIWYELHGTLAQQVIFPFKGAN